MSELMDELKANLKSSSENLEQLVNDIQGMSDAEQEFSELRENVGAAAQALSRNSEKYEAFLVELRESNEKFSDTLDTLKSLEPKEIKDRLDDVLKITKAFSSALEKVRAEAKETSEQTQSTFEQNSENIEQVITLVKTQADAISKLEKKLNSRTALIPLTFLAIVALAGAIIGRILGLV
jgi:uncharacterized protein YoxC